MIASSTCNPLGDASPVLPTDDRVDTPTTDVVAAILTPEALDEMTSLILRANQSAQGEERNCVIDSVDLKELREDLVSLLLATGVAVLTSEYALAFREAIDAAPTRETLARRYKRIARAINPLDPSVCDDRCRSTLSLYIRRGRPSWKPLRPSFLGPNDVVSAAEFQEVRDAASNLAAYHQSWVTSGAPTKIPIDTCVRDGADIFLRAAALSYGPRDLPHHPDSHYVQFLHVLLSPFLDPSEATHSALGARWKRVKAWGVKPSKWKVKVKKVRLAKRL